MRRSVYAITVLLCAFACTICNYAIANNNEQLSINCPAEKDIYMCKPGTAPSPLKLNDFAAGINPVAFEVKETLSNFKKYTVTQYDYTFVDAKGKTARCKQKYYIPVGTMQPPSLNKTINVCQNNPFTLIDKPYEDTYHFYADDKGAPGKLVSNCEKSDIWCLASDLGVNTTQSGTHKFWVTNVLKEQSASTNNLGTWCESEAIAITMNVRPKPTAVLKNQDPISVQMGEFINLMDMVEKNTSGIWKGSDIVSFTSVTKQQLHYYVPRKTGLQKLYYTVDNGACKTTYTMVIEVLSARKSSSDNLNNFTVFPNPTKGNVFVNLSNSIDVEHSISVFDVFGKQHINITANNVKNTIFKLDLSNLPKGAYIVEVRNPVKANSKKLMID